MSTPAFISGSSSGQQQNISSMLEWEPATIDIHGAKWTGQGSYALYDGAVRYEQYEVNMAAKVKEMKCCMV
jgi:hypothetical protein